MQLLSSLGMVDQSQSSGIGIGGGIIGGGSGGGCGGQGTYRTMLL